MTPTRRYPLLLLRSFLALCYLSGDALGYIDPGTGSFVLQIAIAFLIGVAFSIKVFWKKIFAFLRKIFSSKGDADAS